MEQPLPKHGACCLSSINLSEFVKNPYTPDATFDLTAFDEAVSAGIKYLDNIVDLTMQRHPLKEQREVSYNYRNVGLGTFGLATTFMKLGIEYGTARSNALVEIIYNNMFRMAVTTSSKLAAKKGSFPKYTEKVWDGTIIQKHFKPEEIEKLHSQGLRNCSLLSIAPTGLA